MIIAYCECCTLIRHVKLDRNPETLQGVCGDCQAESDVAERPLSFGLLFCSDPLGIEELPKGWLAE